MLPSQSSDRRRPKTKALPAPESLETRSLMTGGVGNTFALMPATIDEPGGTVDVEFTINPSHFGLPRGKMALGVDVAAETGAAVNPLITAITDSDDKVIAQAIHTIYNPHLSHGAVGAGAGTSAVLTPIQLSPRKPTEPGTFTATITGQNKTSGDVLVGFYLPGDADGNGVVNKVDLGLVRKALNSVAGDDRYRFDADANRDGRIGQIDLAYALQNQGVSTTVSPTISTILDPASDTGAPDRITDLREVRITGAGTPGASLLIQDVSGRQANITSTIGPDGQYALTLPLSDGINRYRITSTDSFGQTITGSIEQIVYSPVAQGLLSFSKKPA